MSRLCEPKLIGVGPTGWDPSPARDPSPPGDPSQDAPMYGPDHRSPRFAWVPRARWQPRRVKVPRGGAGALRGVPRIGEPEHASLRTWLARSSDLARAHDLAVVVDMVAASYRHPPCQNVPGLCEARATIDRHRQHGSRASRWGPAYGRRWCSMIDPGRPFRIPLGTPRRTCGHPRRPAAQAVLHFCLRTQRPPPRTRVVVVDSRSFHASGRAT